MIRKFQIQMLVILLLLVMITLPVASDPDNNEIQTVLVPITQSDGMNESVVTKTLEQENGTELVTTISNDTENSSVISQLLARKMSALKNRANISPIIPDEQSSNVHLANSLTGNSVSTLRSTENESYTYVTQWGTQGYGYGQLYYPEGVAVDASGNVYVADYMNSRIQKFSALGTFITSWGRYGTGHGQFNGVDAVAADASGNVYVTDLWNSRIQKFDANGVYITQWGSYGTGSGQFDAPTGVAVDNLGYVYIVDSNNKRIQKFSSSGAYITEWDAGRFPYWIAANASGNVYVSDVYGLVSKFDSTTGEVLATLGGFYVPSGVAVDASGNLYVADSFNYRIKKFDSHGGLITQWGAKGTGNGHFDYPNGIAVDTQENVYVTDYYNNRVQVFERVVTPTQTPLTYSMTCIENYNNKGYLGGVFDECNNVASRLNATPGWKMLFYHKDDEVTQLDFGTSDDHHPSLADSTFYYHSGHGVDPLHAQGNVIGTIIMLKNYNEIITPPFYQDGIVAQDVHQKWGGKNKWVMLQSCSILADRKWDNALTTSHGILGYSTSTNENSELPNVFFDYAIDKQEPIVTAYRDATIQLFNDPTIQGAVIVKTIDQYTNEQFPGVGYTAPDSDPGTKPVFRNWPCVMESPT